MQQENPQDYDSTLKSLFGDEAREILFHFIPDITVLDDKNIEIDRSTLRADLVYNVLRKGVPHILNVELQVDGDSKMPLRILLYHAGFHAKYGRTVISMILYPFKTRLPKSPYEEKSGNEVILRLHFIPIALWLLDGRKYVRERAIAMYTFLPAMKHVNASMLIQAIYQMSQYYTLEQLRRHLPRFYCILLRTTMISDKEKEEVKEVLHSQYGRDWFIETLPEVIELVALGKNEGKLEGKIEGKLEGQLETLRQEVVSAVQVKYPALRKLAEEYVSSLSDSVHLRQLIPLIYLATDEKTVRRLLQGLPPAKH